MQIFWVFYMTFFVGCGGNLDTWEGFIDEYAHKKCLVYKECYRAMFEGEYENRGCGLGT